MSKGSRRHTGGKRESKKREQRPSFHIFCEGVNTEPLYFNQFPISNMGHCKGYGQTKIPLVETALKYKRENRITKNSKDQIWVVFDYDYDGNLQPKQKDGQMANREQLQDLPAINVVHVSVEELQDVSGS